MKIKWCNRKFAVAVLACLAVLSGSSFASGDRSTLSEFPLETRLMLARTSVRVEPEREARVTAPAGGVLKLEVKEAEGMLPSGAIIGVMDQGRLDIEERLHALETVHSERRDTDEWRLEQRTRKAAFQERLANLERQLDLISRVQAEPEIAQLYLGENHSGEEDNGDEPGPIADRQARLRDDIELVRAVLANYDDGVFEEEHIEIEALKRRQREFELERRRNLSSIRIPFDGRYRLLLPRVEGQSEYRVEGGEEIAVFQDTRRYYAATPVQSVDWRIHPRHRLVLEIANADAGGAALAGRFHSEREVFTRGQPDLLYVFVFPESQSQRVGRLAGGFVPSVLWLELESPARIVPKIRLAVDYPEIFREKTWAAGAREVFGQANDVVVGSAHVAILTGQ